MSLRTRRPRLFGRAECLLAQLGQPVVPYLSLYRRTMHADEQTSPGIQLRLG